MSARFDKDRYDDALRDLQGRLNQLMRHAHDEGVGTVALFEGPDAAGKGGAIRRLTRGIRAPVFQVVPVAAPTEDERAHHYLWRFWNHVPRAGHVTIFDRSWYGRVLVERVEGFADEPAWRRAYQEINEFERQLQDGGLVLLKYWIHVGEREQLERFEKRRDVPFKKYKLTPEDFRNRAKRPLYDAAANEMFAHTDTRNAPWILVPGDDKAFARITVLERACAALEEALHR